MDAGLARILSKAKTLLASNEPQEAFAALHDAIAWPGRLVRDRDALQEAVVLLGRIGAALGDLEVSAAARSVATDPDDPGALLDLARALSQAALYAPAATLLARARLDAPADLEIAFELVQVLRREGLHTDTCEVIRTLPELGGAEGRTALALSWMFAGEVDAARELIADEGAEIAPLVAAEVQAMLARFDRVKGVTPLDAQDLRGWHFVLYGALLLHESPYGRSEGMGGRYAFMQDSEELCAEGIVRLQAALAALDVTPPRVILLPDRSSQILGLAASRLFEVMPMPWSGADEGLVIAYDLDRVQPAIGEALFEHRPGQILFGHASRWTDPYPYASDLTTLMYEAIRAPWDAQMHYDAKTEKIETRPANDDPAGVIADRIAELARKIDRSSLEDLEAVEAIARVARDLDADSAAGARKDQGRRPRQLVGSPVQSTKLRCD